LIFILLFILGNRCIATRRSMMGDIRCLTHDEAWQIAGAARDALLSAGKHANFCIVNAFGHPLVTVSMDATRPVTLGFAVAKAMESAKTGQSTRWMQQKLSAGEITLGLFGLDSDAHVPWAGGCPVYCTQAIQLGAMGVSGLTEEEDEMVCRDAIAAKGFLADRPG
jgi:uncharacterized protein GlcG (DUF336 family)